MRLDTSQQMRADMRFRMAPRMIQSMEILQLPLMALQERIDQELAENIALVDERRDPEAGEAPDNAAPDAPDRSESDVTEQIVEDWLESFEAGHRPSRAALAEESDRKHDAMQNMASRPRPISDELSDQIAFLDLDETVRGLAQFIIHNLDENGYLTMPLEEVARDYGAPEGAPATLEQAAEALAAVQRLDPPGIGARDLRECLLLQLTPETPHREILHAIISNHLEDLRQNRLPLIEKKTGVPIDKIKDALEQLRRLNPRPGAESSTDNAAHVMPDLVVDLDEHGLYQVRLVDDYTPKLSISRRYQNMLKNKDTDSETRDYIQKRVQSARWLIESIEQRRNTLLKVASAIIDHQKDFLDKGPEWIEPLKMQQIADRVGVHVTTVSRAVDDKWVQTPRGIFPLKRFFGGGTTTSDGEAVAWDTIKQKLLELIGKEDKSNPLSDEELVDALGKSGLPVARRTVTKYRKALKIPASRGRKVY